MKRILTNAVLICVSIIFCLLITEIALRFTDYQYLTHKRVKFPKSYFQVDPILGTDHAPNQPPAEFEYRGPTYETFTNQLGCFDYDRAIEKDYVLVVGDSTTWGYAALEDKWTSLLEKISGKQVLKCGVSGTGTKHQLIKAQRIIEKVGIKPAVIICLHSNNDFNDDTVFPGTTIFEGKRVKTLKSLDLRTGVLTYLTQGELEEKNKKFLQHSKSIKQFFVEHLVILALIKHARKQVNASPNSNVRTPEPILISRYQFFLYDVDIDKYPWVEKAFKAHMNNILEFQRFAESIGAKFVLFTKTRSDAGLRAELARILTKELPYYFNINEYIDLAANGKRYRHRFDGHWDKFGNRLAAEGMYKYLIEARVF